MDVPVSILEFLSLLFLPGVHMSLVLFHPLGDGGSPCYYGAMFPLDPLPDECLCLGLLFVAPVKPAVGLQ